MSQAVYVRNPRTNALILVNGPTYQKLSDAERRQADSTRQTLPRPQRRGRRASLKAAAHKAAAHKASALKVAEPEPLEDTLMRTRQPALRASLKRMRADEPRGAATRGWAARAPPPGRARHVLHERCGDDAFLLPQQEKFPIMRKCGTGYEVRACDCRVDCGGLQAAYQRARQHKYPAVAKRAQQLLATQCPDSKQARERRAK